MGVIRWIIASSCLLSKTFVLCDVGPYFRSTSYEQGTHGAWPHQSFHSSERIAPLLNIRKYDERCDDGRHILLSPIGAQLSQPGPMILDNHGSLVWTSPYGKNWGLDVQMLHDEPHLTFCAWQGVGTHVTCYVLNSTYDQVHAIRPRHGWGADATEFSITQQNTVVMTISKMREYDLTPVRGPRHGLMRDVGFQEIDLKSGELLFDWSWADHFNITDVIDSKWPKGKEGQHDSPWDPFHINSVQKDRAGNYLVSSRHTSTVGYISHTTGDFVWKLGGKGNTFEDLSSGKATGISMQHHARWIEENCTFTLFNNAVRSDSPYQTEGLIIDLDTDAMTAKVRRTYVSPHHIGSESRGSMQLLEDGRVLLGLGVNAGWAEYAEDGSVLCDAHFGPESGFGDEDILSYRVFKRHWIGRPRTRPTAVLKQNAIFVSWNGATEVHSWALREVSKAVNTTFAIVLKAGFETRISIPANMTASDVCVTALDNRGEPLESSSAIRLRDTNVQPVQAPLMAWS